MDINERGISQRAEARVFAAQKIQRELMDQIGEEKFRRFTTLPDRAQEFVKHEYAQYIMTHLMAILNQRYQERVLLNISECNKDDELEVLIAGRTVTELEGNLIESVQKGKEAGIEMVFKHFSGEFPLKYYERREMERFGLEGEADNWGISYPFPTVVDGVSVCYFYPDQEDIFDDDLTSEVQQAPTISLRIDPVVS